MIAGLWLILACGDSSTDEENIEQKTPQTAPSTQIPQQNRPIPPSLNNGTKQNGPPGLPGSSASEDLTDSWKTTFAVPAQENLGPKPADWTMTVMALWMPRYVETGLTSLKPTAMMPMHR